MLLSSPRITDEGRGRLEIASLLHRLIEILLSIEATVFVLAINPFRIEAMISGASRPERIGWRVGLCRPSSQRPDWTVVILVLLVVGVSFRPVLGPFLFL